MYLQNRPQHMKFGEAARLGFGLPRARVGGLCLFSSSAPSTELYTEQVLKRGL